MGQLYSASTCGVRLCAVQVKLDPLNNRTGDVWHICVHGLKVGFVLPASLGTPHPCALGYLACL